MTLALDKLAASVSEDQDSVFQRTNNKKRQNGLVEASVGGKNRRKAMLSTRVGNRLIGRTGSPVTRGGSLTCTTGSLAMDTLT